MSDLVTAHIDRHIAVSRETAARGSAERPVVTIEPFDVTVTQYRAVCECGSTATAHTREMAERLRNIHLAYYCERVDRRPTSG